MEYALEFGGTDQALQLGRDLGLLLYTVGGVVSDVGGLAKGAAALGKVGVTVSSKTLGQLLGKDGAEIGATIARLELDSAGNLKSVVMPSGGKLLNQYNPLNQGPLPASIADTFRSATYAEVVTQKPTTLYRVYGGSAKELGAYWTATKPTGPVQSIIDSALNPQWGNTAVNVVKIEVPAGTKYFEGVAAPQGGLVGGGSQVLFPKDFKIDPSWVR